MRHAWMLLSGLVLAGCTGVVPPGPSPVPTTSVAPAGLVPSANPPPPVGVTCPPPRDAVRIAGHLVDGTGLKLANDGPCAVSVTVRLYQVATEGSLVGQTLVQETTVVMAPHTEHWVYGPWLRCGQWDVYVEGETREDEYRIVVNERPCTPPPPCIKAKPAPSPPCLTIA